MRRLLFSLALVLMSFAGTQVQAGDGHGHGHKGGKICCPACNYTCELSVTKDKETKHCFEVDCEPICIPKVTFPWQKGHGKGKVGDCYSSSGCAKVKVVHKLRKEEYECSKCKCVWTPISRKEKGMGDKDYDYEKESNGEAAEGDGNDSVIVPSPPPIEARMLRKPITVQAAQATERETAPKKSFKEILTGFFNGRS